ncbi:VanZ family protein [Brevibacterium moorei]|uniref:VanZ family protein n=1 Tax=Brevibacterium moorei TaxID=2968457 RepID=UPI00211BD17E|nr:VanZ family protein [Brevibacterium sp. 68QC2CO]
MSTQLFAAAAAFLIGGAVAVVLFVPFVFVNYRRAGRLTWRRTLAWVAFLVYFMALWTYTLLPLPDPDQIRCVGAQTNLLQFLRDIRGYPHSSLRQLAHNPAFLQFGLNIVLFTPLGFLLRGLWRRGIVFTTCAGFVLSLAIESTQYTGVWGVYPCAYRFFDVDDLLANTGGALFGAVASALVFAVFAPGWMAGRGGSRGIENPYGTRGRGAGRPGTPVTAGRRLLAMLCDGLTLYFCSFCTAIVVGAVNQFVLGHEPGGDVSAIQDVSFWIPLVLSAALTLLTGRTVGDLAVRVRYDFGSARGWRLFGLRLLRFLGGVGGYQLLYAMSGFADLAFVVVAVVLAFALSRQRGLPGVLTNAPLIDDVER